MRFFTATIIVVSSVIALHTNAYAEDASQTDWSGGDGYLGTVTEWSNGFKSAAGIDWAHEPGRLMLLSPLPIEHEISTTFGQPAGVALADIDGDLDNDIVGAAFQGDEVAWWENDGTGNGWIQHSIVTLLDGAVIVHPVDIDFDGDIDVAVAAEHASTVGWWENDGSGGGWAQHIVDSNVNGPFSVCTVDFDNDSDLDLLSAVFYASDIVWWENTDGAAMSWSKHTIDGNFLGAWCAAAEDMDGDNDPDVVGVSYNSNDVCWWENTDGGLTWIKYTIDGNFSNPVDVCTKDMNGDDNVDVVAASFISEVAWWQADGTGWTKHVVDNVLNQPFSICAEDIDGDGDNDVLGNEREGDTVLWWENVDAAGTMWLEHLVDDQYDGPNNVTIADVNGDGNMDLIASFAWDNSIVWYELADQYCPTGSLLSSILDIGEPVGDWGSIEWDCAEQTNTCATVLVRSSNASYNMGSWIEVVSSGDDLSDYLENGTRYLQYQVSLTTEDGTLTPRFDEIRINWEPLAIQDEPAGAPDEFLLRGAMPNPSTTGTSTISFVVLRDCILDLSVYDMQGRKITTIAQGAYRPGEHCATVHGLPSGTYVYRMEAEGFRDTGSLVVR